MIFFHSFVCSLFDIDTFYVTLLFFLLSRFRDIKICCVRPTDLPEMHVNVSAPSNRRGSSQSWARDSNKPFPSPQENARGDHNNRRQSSTGSMNSLNNVTTPEQWSRGMVSILDRFTSSFGLNLNYHSSLSLGDPTEKYSRWARGPRR